MDIDPRFASHIFHNILLLLIFFILLCLVVEGILIYGLRTCRSWALITWKEEEHTTF
jgi:hypothetical protein